MINFKFMPATIEFGSSYTTFDLLCETEIKLHAELAEFLIEPYNLIVIELSQD